MHRSWPDEAEEESKGYPARSGRLILQLWEVDQLSPLPRGFLREMTPVAVAVGVKGALGPTHREEVTERYVREDLVGPVLRALALALPPELLKLLQQGPRGTKEQGVLLGDGIVQRRVIAVTT